ncbi:MAG: hypothetical protein LBL95_08710, partial [Deltaproteobacteria bacterium]|nr:hypothetical protein [Deltaproteobacteria bacterium]
MSKAQEIRDRGLALGLSSVGIIRPEAMDGYAGRVLERLARTPGAAMLNNLLGFSRTREAWPWAGAIVVATLDLTRYALPPGPARHFGKHYLLDSRRNPAAPEAKRMAAFTAFMEGLGLRVAHDEHPGVTAMRWAAMSAGLGWVRRNNFLYGPNGSFLAIAAWIIDQELELVGDVPLRPCPENCDRCVRACPTGALSAPFTMDLTRCVSLLTTSNSGRTHGARTRRDIGLWLYGCD